MVNFTSTECNNFVDKLPRLSKQNASNDNYVMLLSKRHLNKPYIGEGKFGSNRVFMNVIYIMMGKVTVEKRDRKD